MGQDFRLAAENLRAARSTLRWDRPTAFAALGRLFRSGRLPEHTPEGEYSGELFAFQVFPGLDWLADRLNATWRPWRGKRFNPDQNAGENLFSRSSLFATRLVWPFYQSYEIEGPEIYNAFPFHTWIGPGKADPDREVLKIDYDLPENPKWIVRQVLDELVQLDPGLYLGKAYFRWPTGQWQTIAYFSLFKNSGGSL